MHTESNHTDNTRVIPGNMLDEFADEQVHHQDLAGIFTYSELNKHVNNENEVEIQQQFERLIANVSTVEGSIIIKRSDVKELSSETQR